MIVPLDGSPLAENVLPYVDTVVRGCSTMVVVFLRVVEPAVYLSGDGKRDPLKWDVAERMDARGKQEAQHYLAEVVGKAGYAGVDIRQVVLLGKPADAICEFANNNGAGPYHNGHARAHGSQTTGLGERGREGACARPVYLYC